MSEIRIAICDDDRRQVELLVKYIHELNLDFEYSIITSEDPENLISVLDEEELDIAFLDIEMGDITGIDVGKEIRDRFKDCIIVFITGFRDYALDAFQIKAKDYLIKPITPEKFRTLMEDVMEQYLIIHEGGTRNYFTIENKEGYVRLDYDQIYYFEKVQRKVRVHTLNNHYEFYGTLKEVKKYLNMSEYFSQCHQGYIVNAKKIIEMRKNKVTLDVINKELPVSRRFREELVEAFENVLFDGK